MKLGYMSIPPRSKTGGRIPDSNRAALALNLGFSEFYDAVDRDTPMICAASCDKPEMAERLRVLSEAPRLSSPRVVAEDGKVRTCPAPSGMQGFAVPSHSPDQVKSNAHHDRAVFSVSWLCEVSLARHWSAYVTGRTHAGLRACPDDWRVARTIFVCEDPARAEAAVKSDGSPCRAYYSKIAGPDADAARIEALIDACVLWGPLQTVLDRISGLTASSAQFGTLALVDHAWPDADLAEQSLASLADAVIPFFHQHSKKA